MFFTTSNPLLILDKKVIPSGINGLSREEIFSAATNVAVGVESLSALMCSSVHGIYGTFSSISSAAIAGLLSPRVEVIKEIVEKATTLYNSIKK